MSDDVAKIRKRGNEVRGGAEKMNGREKEVTEV